MRCEMLLCKDKHQQMFALLKSLYQLFIIYNILNNILPGSCSFISHPTHRPRLLRIIYYIVRWHLLVMSFRQELTSKFVCRRVGIGYKADAETDLELSKFISRPA